MNKKKIAIICPYPGTLPPNFDSCCGKPLTIGFDEGHDDHSVYSIVGGAAGQGKSWLALKESVNHIVYEKEHMQEVKSRIARTASNIKKSFTEVKRQGGSKFTPKKKKRKK